MKKTLFARRIYNKSLPGAPFGAKGRFLVDFGVPEGTLKLVKIYGTFWEKGSWEPSGSHFGRFSTLFSILVPFLVDSGSILGHPGSILGPSGPNFGVIILCNDSFHFACWLGVLVGWLGWLAGFVLWFGWVGWLGWLVGLVSLGWLGWFGLSVGIVGLFGLVCYLGWLLSWVD